MTLKQHENKAIKQVTEWNNKYSIGQSVTVKLDNGSKVLTKTTSEASVMSCQAVIWLEGIKGCYSLHRVEAFEG
ncbi:MAG: hypothetical protein ACM3P0_18060 [Acidobacteriota bacterium]